MGDGQGLQAAAARCSGLQNPMDFIEWSLPAGEASRSRFILAGNEGDLIRSWEKEEASGP